MRDDTYELAYNAASLLVGRGDYELALKKLQNAEGELCFLSK